MFSTQLEQAKPSLEPIILSLQPEKDTAYPMYAIGIARQANGDAGSRKSETTGSGLAADSKLDHCSCLLEKENRKGSWTVVRCFSVVELKYGSDNECVGATIKDNKAEALHFKSAGGVIAQALTYTMGWVLPNHASLGDRTRELNEFPWATIIGKKKVDDKKSGIQKGNLDKKVQSMDEETTGSYHDAGKGKAQGFGNAKQDKKTQPTISTSKFRWMSGKIYVPEYCGDFFSYSATGCGSLDLREVVSVYLDTLLFGLCAAKILLEAIRANDKIVPLPSSGRKVKFGNVELEGMKLLGKSHVGKRLRSDPDDDGKWAVSQGEIFSGKIIFSDLKKRHLSSNDHATVAADDETDDTDDVTVEAIVIESAVTASLKESTDEDDLVEEKVEDDDDDDSEEDEIATPIESSFDESDPWESDLFADLADLKHTARAPRPPTQAPLVFFFKEDSEVVDVVVKVAALSVHKYLNHPDKAWLALGQIHGAFALDAASYPYPEQCNLTFRRDLFNVLLAAERTPTGLTTIMADLSSSYNSLTPERDGLTFKSIWSTFTRLVLRILVPLAHEGVIHPDIRPGWDVTSNILYSSYGRPDMQIIDFDSLIIHCQWNEVGANHRYIKHETGASSFKFLWWQCVTIGYAWYAKVKQIDMEKVNMREILNDRTNRFTERLGRKFCARAASPQMEYEVLIDSLEVMLSKL